MTDTLAPTPVDLLIDAWYVVTMNATRDIIHRGSVAVLDGAIVDVGKTADLQMRYLPARRIGGDRFVLTPGMVNSHIHITGEPLTRGFVPDDTPFEENVFVWLTNLYAAHEAPDERCSAQLAAVEMLRSGTTTFLEAGTISFLDEVIDALTPIGIRGKLGAWVWDLPPEPDVYRQDTDAAIARLQDQLERYRSTADGRLGAWSTVVGHTTCSDPLWKAARALADEHDVGMSFHMSPAKIDPDGFIAEFGQRPMVHLDELGVLADDVCMTHCVHVDDQELDVMAAKGTSVAHCPTTALKVSYGVTQIGKMPEMVQRGINVSIGTDGNNASNYSDLMRRDVSRCRVVQGRADGPADVSGGEGLRDGDARWCALDRHAGRDRFAGGRQACGPRAARHRPARVASTAQRDEPVGLVGRRPWRAHGGRRRRGRRRGRPHDDASTKRPCGPKRRRLGEAIVTRAGLPDRAKYPML